MTRIQHPYGFDFSSVEVTSAEIEPYHQPARGPINSTLPLEQRPFIAWDGEGMNLAGKNKPQSFVLFGASTGDMITGEAHIHTFDLLDLIVKVGEENRGAFHVGFAFNYDANMIVRSLHSR